MNKRQISLLLLVSGVIALSIGLFAIEDFDIRNNLLFLGVVLGVAGMIFKIASMLDKK